MSLLHWFRWLVYVQWVSLDTHSASIQRQFQLNAIITPSNATNKNIVWTSSNTSVAIVDSNWLVTPVWNWDITISIELDWHTDSCSLSVSLIPVTWVSLNKNSLEFSEAWETSQLTATIAPSDASNKNITWSSSNTSIATVNSTGLVTSVAEGTCTITVTTEDWWYTASCSVTNSYKKPVSVTFSYTWADQSYTIPYTQCYKLEAWWAGSYDAAWWYASWVTCLTKWTVLRIMVWARWNNGWNRYWFGWSSNYSNCYDWAWLSWIFTGNTAITASDSSRALVIWWWAGSCSGRWNWWAWWWTNWNSWWTNWYWTQGWWWTQTGRWSWWNAWAYQFCWWNGSWSYWAWGWWWWRGWNGTAWDSSAWDDKWAGWWSWYVKSTMTSRTLTTWWWKAAQNHWCVKIASI